MFHPPLVLPTACTITISLVGTLGNQQRVPTKLIVIDSTRQIFKRDIAKEKRPFSKDGQPPHKDEAAELKRLGMENQLLRDFLQFTKGK